MAQGCGSAEPANNEKQNPPIKFEFSKIHRYKKPSSLNPPASEIPDSYKAMVMNVKKGDNIVPTAFYVKSVPDISGNIIKTAHIENNGAEGHIIINIEFTDEGAKMIEKLTKEILDEDIATNIKQPLGVIINGKLISTPHIQSVISKSCQIVLLKSVCQESTCHEIVKAIKALKN